MTDQPEPKPAEDGEPELDPEVLEDLDADRGADGVAGGKRTPHTWEVCSL